MQHSYIKTMDVLLDAKRTLFFPLVVIKDHVSKPPCGARILAEMKHRVV